jgi:ATP-dependent RNA helicase DHX57
LILIQDLKEKIDPESPAESVNLPTATLIKRHLALGFDEQDVRSAVNMLQRGSPFAINLLKEGSPDAACLEALLLLVPECRLPKRFLGERASVPFVTSIHRGDESVKLRWIQKIVVEQGGWPATFVSGCLSDLPEPELPALVRRLNHLLCPSVPDTVEPLSDQDALVAKNERTTEILALQSIYEGTQSHFEGSTQILSVPVPSTGIRLSVCFSSKESYPEGHAFCPIYLSSQTIPAFLRLHMLRRLLFRWAEKRLLGEPILLDAVQDVVAEWQKTQGHPPDSSEVMTFFQTATPGPATARKPSESSEDNQPDLPQRSKKIHRKKVDHRNDAQVLAEFGEMQTRSGFQKLRPIRDALPASKSRAELLKVLETSQVVIVKGDTGIVFSSRKGFTLINNHITGSGKTTQGI